MGAAAQAVDVCIVGGGPTGLATANLLGRSDVRVLLVERSPTTSDAAKAISVDGESLRTMQRAGLFEELREVVLPGTGTRYFGANGRPIAYARGPQRQTHGYPIKSPFVQPDFERVLYAGLSRLSTVEAAFSTRFVAATQDSLGVVVQLEGADGPREVRCQYLLGCDGGRSAVRRLLDINMTGRSFDDPWIVIDTVEDEEDHRYGMHHGEPARPYVVIPGGGGRCRYEFLLHPGEVADPPGEPAFELVERLLRPHRRIRPEQIERVAVYNFHALNADRWRQGRIFLVGDAAHMMPPFAGQGLNSGIRDANNLAWKLTAVVEGRAGPELLDTYEAERRPHVQAVIDLSVRLGSIMMTTSALRARLRDLAVRMACRLAPLRRFIEQGRFFPAQAYGEGFVVPGSELKGLVGRALPQPRVLQPAGQITQLDDVLGSGFALLAVEPRDQFVPEGALWQLLEPRLVRVLLDERFPQADSIPTVSDFDGGLREALAAASGRYVLVRPDRYVAAVFTAAEADRVADALSRAWGADRL